MPEARSAWDRDPSDAVRGRLAAPGPLFRPPSWFEPRCSSRPPSAQPHERVLRETCRSPEPSAPPVPDPRSCHRVGRWLAPGPAPSLHRQLPWEDLPALCTRSLPRCSRAQGCTSGEPPPWSSSQGQGSWRLRGLDCGVSSGSAPSPACFPVHGARGSCAWPWSAAGPEARGPEALPAHVSGWVS